MGKGKHNVAAANAKADKKNDRAVKNSLKKHKERAGGDYKSTWVRFCLQVRAYNLRIRDVQADGNCLFRAVADQLEGNQDKYKYYREAAVDYMREVADLFQPFVDEDYETYLRKMAKDGTWAGHLELLAIAHACNVDVIIHQLEAPRFELRNSMATPDNPVLREIHVSYHDGQHYASVRSVEDFGNGPAIPFVIPSNPINLNDQTKDANGASKQEQIVMQLTGCKNLEYVKLILKYNAYDTDATVEALVAESNANGGVFSYDDEEKKPQESEDLKEADQPSEATGQTEEVEKKENSSNVPAPAVKAKVSKQDENMQTLKELRRKNFNDLTNKERKLLRQLEKTEKVTKNDKRKSEKPKTKKKDEDNTPPPNDVGSIAI